MSEFTNKDVPILCGECLPSAHIIGLEEMIAHILEIHKAYDHADAVKYAHIWTEDAYIRIEQEAVDFAYEQSRRKHAPQD